MAVLMVPRWRWSSSASSCWPRHRAQARQVPSSSAARDHRAGRAVRAGRPATDAGEPGVHVLQVSRVHRCRWRGARSPRPSLPRHGRARLDFAEREYDPRTRAGHLARVPLAGSIFAIVEDYVLIPACPCSRASSRVASEPRSGAGSISGFPWRTAACGHAADPFTPDRHAGAVASPRSRPRPPVHELFS